MEGCASSFQDCILRDTKMRRLEASAGARAVGWSRRLALITLAAIVAASCSSGSTSLVATSSSSSPPDSILQQRPVREILDPTAPGGDISLTCEPKACTPSDLSLFEVVLAGEDGMIYRLGPVVLTADNVSSAVAVSYPGGPTGTDTTWAVDMTLDTAGAAAMAAATRKAVVSPPPQNQIALVIDGTVVVAPAIMSEIDSGRLSIGTHGKEEADQIASLFN
jgi:hypothetical protein